jgi:hypothetical protein
MQEARVKETQPTTTVKTQEELAESAKTFQRVYAGQQLLDHDLYKLEVANLQRNASYNDNAPVWEAVEHVHFFHSIDSRGRPQTLTNKVGNHVHQVTIDENGKATCGPAVREVKIKRGGRITTKYEPVRGDNHVHEVTYKFSEKVKPATPNVEFAKVQAKVYEGQAAAEAIKLPPEITEGD